MSMARLFLRELRFRAGTFVLALLGVATFAACLIGSRAFLAAHDHRTGQLTAALEERSEERMTALRDEARKFSKNLGFNCMMLPRGQKLGELYADGVGVEQDFERTVELYRTACNRRQGEACYRLGRMYQSGTGVNRSPGTGGYYIGRACDYGYQSACGGS